MPIQSHPIKVRHSSKMKNDSNGLLEIRKIIKIQTSKLNQKLMSLNILMKICMNNNLKRKLLVRISTKARILSTQIQAQIFQLIVNIITYINSSQMILSSTSRIRFIKNNIHLISTITRLIKRTKATYQTIASYVMKEN